MIINQLKCRLAKFPLGYFCGMQNEVELIVNQSGHTAFSFLKGRLNHINQQQLSNLFHKQLVRCNGQNISDDQAVLAGDVLRLTFLPKNELEAVALPLDIVYEDTDLLVVNKPSGMPMHPGLGNYNNSLLNALKHYYQQKNDTQSLLQEALAHRIDKDTSGLVVLAKNKQALSKLSSQFVSGSVERYYLALLWGQPMSEKGVIDVPTGRLPGNSNQFGVSVDGAFGKASKSAFEVVNRHGAYTLVKLTPITGRTHQLRLHMQFMGHAIVGDKRYPQTNCKNFNPIGRLALHAAYIGFFHPVSGEFIDFQAPLPSSMRLPAV